MLTGDFQPEKYHDNYREALLELIERKAAGQEIKRPKPVAGKVTDLMEALRASVEAARKEKTGGGQSDERSETTEPDDAQGSTPRSVKRRKAG
jgi:DNA end-binding protein Ku